MIQYDLIVVGGGISGMTAALSALENGVKNVIIIEREDSLGGVVNQCIHSGFGSSILNVEVQVLNMLILLEIDYLIIKFILS